MVEDDYLIPLGELKEEDMLVLVTVTVPHDIREDDGESHGSLHNKCNTRKAVQVILDDEDDISREVSDI